MFYSSIDCNKKNPFDIDLKDIINRISYSYDGFGNVNSVTFAESITQTGTTTHYVYDALNRLIKSYINSENPNIYSYDSNGNILSKNGVSYVYDPVYKDRLMSVGNDITFEYNSSSPLFPTKIIKGNNVFNLVWNTNRLESVNDISFVYDHFKRRVKKIRGSCVTKYFYSGETLEAIEISENNNTYKFIYHYDENRKLIGFSYNNNEYIYIRDILGNIRSIYGINEGTYLVNYSYDDRGQPTIASNNTEIGNLLAQKNCILYKGYLYDFETGWFWLSTRFYDSSIGRFLSPDSFDYLDTSSINELNLYGYASNNPVNYFDPSGHFILSIGLLFAIGGIAGAAIGAASSIVGQYITNGYSWENFSRGQLALDTFFGGLSGILSMSSFGKVAMITANAGISLLGALCGHLINGSDFSKNSTLVDIALSTFLGGLAGFLGGPGALNAGYLNYAPRTSNFIRAAGLYDDVLTKVLAGFYSTPGIAKNALRLSGQNLLKQRNKMVIGQAYDALTKSLAYSYLVLLFGTSGKGWLYTMTGFNF